MYSYFFEYLFIPPWIMTYLFHKQHIRTDSKGSFSTTVCILIENYHEFLFRQNIQGGLPWFFLFDKNKLCLLFMWNKGGESHARILSILKIKTFKNCKILNFSYCSNVVQQNIHCTYEKGCSSQPAFTCSKLTIETLELVLFWYLYC